MVILMQDTINYLSKNYPQKLDPFSSPKDGEVKEVKNTRYIKFLK